MPAAVRAFGLGIDVEHTVPHSREILVLRADGIEIEEDRAQAIEDALRIARADDVVLIAGKGHETYQEIDGRRLPFDDVEVARESLRLIWGDGGHA